MMKDDHRIVKVFLDDEERPFAEFHPPAKFELDTTKIPDGPHKLRIVARSSQGVEGVREIPFVVKNGPTIDIVGLKANDEITERVPITINAYGSETNDKFVIRGSETPKAIPAWVWALVITFVAFAAAYLIIYWTPSFYISFF